MGIIVEGTKKFKCKVCGCKFTLDNNYTYSESKEWKPGGFNPSYYLHHVYVNCPQCANPIEVRKYKTK